MKLSRKSDYALRAVRHISGLQKGELSSISAIAEAEKIPREFLAKILQDLTMGGILVSFRGVKGGYALARDAKQVTFLNVIEAIDGPMHLNLCTEPGGCVCKKNQPCGLRDFWTSHEKVVKNALTKQNFGRYKPKKGRK